MNKDNNWIVKVNGEFMWAFVTQPDGIRRSPISIQEYDTVRSIYEKAKLILKHRSDSLSLALFEESAQMLTFEENDVNYFLIYQMLKKYFTIHYSSILRLEKKTKSKLVERIPAENIRISHIKFNPNNHNNVDLDIYYEE